MRFHLAVRMVKDLISQAISESFSWSRDGHSMKADAVFHLETYTALVSDEKNPSKAIQMTRLHSQLNMNECR